MQYIIVTSRPHGRGGYYTLYRMRSHNKHCSDILYYAAILYFIFRHAVRVRIRYGARNLYLYTYLDEGARVIIIVGLRTLLNYKYLVNARGCSGLHPVYTHTTTIAIRLQLRRGNNISISFATHPPPNRKSTICIVTHTVQYICR